MKALSMALFNVSEEDIQYQISKLRADGWSEDDIDRLKVNNFDKLAAQCRRTIPAPKPLLDAFEKVLLISV